AIKSAEKIKKKLDNAGKNSWILVADEITPEKLLGLRIDCLVDCACPRIADDSQYFKKPILRPEDIDEL
ncbi:MAG: diphthamide biosynthesis enzyme Dph2, partial [Thermotogae bacterium]